MRLSSRSRSKRNAAVSSTKRSTPKGRSTTNVILPMREPYMQQIVSGSKNYEFRRYRLPSTIEYIWFYSRAPSSSVEYVCAILPAHVRGDAPIEEDGLGNHEFNTNHPDWEHYDFAYRIRSVHQLRVPLSLDMLRQKYGFKSAPRGMMYTPLSMIDQLNLAEETRLI